MRVYCLFFFYENEVSNLGKLMRLRECGNAERLFQNPGSDVFKSKLLCKVVLFSYIMVFVNILSIKVYQQNLVVNIRSGSKKSANEELRQELNMLDQIEDFDNQSIVRVFFYYEFIRNQLFLLFLMIL